MPESKPIRTVKRPKPNLESEVLRELGTMRGENPLIPIVLDMFEAALNEGPSQEKTELAEIYNRLVVGKIPRESIERIVKNYRSLPESFKDRIAPQRTMNINFNSSTAPVSVTDTQRLRKFSNSYNDSAFRDLRRLLNLSDDLEPAIAPKEPKITKITPKKDGHLPEDSVQLHVLFPKSDSPAFKVILSREFEKIDVKPPDEDYAIITPKVLKSGNKSISAKLLIKLPGSFRDGHIRFSVSSQTAVKPVESAKIPIFKKQFPPATLISPAKLGCPEITGISNSSQQFPGKKIFIDGRNFGDLTILDPGKLSDGLSVLTGATVASNVVLRLIASTSEEDILLPVNIEKKSPANGIGQISAIIPVNCIPGNYWLQVEVSSVKLISLNNWNDIQFPNGKESLAFDFKVLPHKYKVNFNTIRCIDESDPEDVGILSTFGNPGDEIVTRWAVVADQFGWSKGTGEYENFDDGDVASYNSSDSSVYMTDGSFGEVKIALVVNTDLYESDEEETKQTQGVLNVTSEIALEIGTLLLKLGVPKAGAIFAAAGSIVKSISVLVSFLVGGYNNLGRQQFALTAEELQVKTNNPQRQFSGQQDFINNDKTGSYSLTYTVTRLNE